MFNQLKYFGFLSPACLFPPPLFFLFYLRNVSLAHEPTPFPEYTTNQRRRGGGDFSTTMAFSVVSCFPRGTKCFDFFSLKKKKKVFSYVWFCFSRGGIPFPLVNSRTCLLLFYLRPFGGGEEGGHQQLPKLGARFPAKVKFAKKDDLFLGSIFSTWFSQAMLIK